MGANDFSFNGSGTPGSPEVKGSDFSGSPADQVQKENLEKLVGRQGEELGEYRKFFGDMAPLLEKLDANPELVQAILDGKIDASLAKAVSEGKVSFGDAKAVTEAHNDVKKDLGEKKYEKASAEDIAKLVDDKVAAMRGELLGNMKADNDLRAFEATVNEFIANTPDFPKYAKEIDQWLDEHDVTDIKIAYYAVKGEMSERDARGLAAKDQAEYEKNLALNAGGGNGRVTYSGEGAASMADNLIAGRASANHF